MVEMTKDLDSAAIGVLEARLAAEGAPSLTSMRDRQRLTVFQILHRGKIRTDDEWRLLNSIVADTADQMLDASSRDDACAMLRDYEQRVRSSLTKH
jgi:hypothetical protein